MVEKNIKKNLDKIYNAALLAASPISCINEFIQEKNELLKIGKKKYNLHSYEKIYVISFGKAACGMAIGTQRILKKRIAKGIIVSNASCEKKVPGFKFIESSHPLPDDKSVKAANAIISLLNQTKKNDLVIFLISGGGSSMIALPDENITLEDKKITTQILLKSGVDIKTLNIVRKKMSKIKGGGLLKYSFPSEVATLIMSDVVGDQLDVIASGPTLPDKSDAEEAWREIIGLEIENQLPHEVIKKLKNSSRKSNKKQKLSKENTVIIGSNLKSLEKAKKQAESLGYNTLILTSQIKGEAKTVAKSLASIALEIRSSNVPIEKPACVIVGGETSVTVKGNGIGGRNSEMALAFAIEIANKNKISALFAGTDGIDGATNAAGAYCNETTGIKNKKTRINAKDFLANNDSYNYFKKTGDLKITGPSGTNVNDIGIIFIEK